MLKMATGLKWIFPK